MSVGTKGDGPGTSELRHRASARGSVTVPADRQTVRESETSF